MTLFVCVVEVSSLDCALLLSFTEAQQTSSSRWSSIRGPFVNGCVGCAYRGVGCAYRGVGCVYRGVGWVCWACINVLCVADVVCNSEGAYTYSDVCTPTLLITGDLEDNR